MNHNIFKLLVISILLYSCDQLDEDTLSKEQIDQNPIINNSAVFAVSGQSTILDVLGNPQESATITLINSSEKAQHEWISDRLIAYRPNSGASGLDFLIFQIETASKSTTDSLFIQIGDSSDFNTDSCMPYANADHISLDASLSGKVDLIANDQLCNYQLQDVFLVTSPIHGSASFSGSSLLEYTASTSFNEQDSFIYQAILTSNDSAQANRSIYAYVSISATGDSTCTATFNTGIDTVRIDQTMVELNVLANDELCNSTITQMNVASFSLGYVRVTDSNTILFEPQMIGSDSLQYEITLDNGNSYIAHHLIQVLESQYSTCDSIFATEDTLSLGYPSQAVIDMDVLLNDQYCSEQPLPALYLLDSMETQYGVAVVIEQSGYPLIRYIADSAAWENEVSERLRYRVCQGQECSDSYITLLK